MEMQWWGGSFSGNAYCIAKQRTVLSSTARRALGCNTSSSSKCRYPSEREQTGKDCIRDANFAWP